MNPDGAKFTAKQLQDELRPWSAWNFGDRPSHQPLLGMIEETCDELREAIRLWNVPEIRDALADCVVFAADYCNAKGWELAPLMLDPETIMPSRDLETSRERLVHCLGGMAHHHLKNEQGIKGTPEYHASEGRHKLSQVLTYLEAMARHFGWSLLEIVEPIWAKVKLRDFKKNAATGGEVKT